MNLRLLLCLFAATGNLVAAEKLDILGSDYPRVFFFRGCESWSTRPNASFESWSADFSRLSGIMGKCLSEELPGRDARNPEWFSRFKQEHPRQVVLLHFNGNARDPRYETETYFPGHWVYRKAARITADVPAAAGETEIKVADASNFKVNGGRYRTSSDDIALLGVTADGKHDWGHCEQVQLLAVDAKSNTIRVKRGCYGTRPLAFKAGQARAAAHAVEGPWGKTSHLLWFYNFSTQCPKDPAGKTCADRLVDELARWLGPGGKLAALDGLEFDVMFNETHGDTDGDGEPDDGVSAGVNRYGIGMVEFARQLRQRLGPDRIIQGDGALGPGGRYSQRAFGLLNGIESEGWPNLNDWQLNDWSGGLNRHAFWQANAFAPAFSYINHKWVEHVPDKPGEQQFPEVPFARHRLVFAAGQFVDAMICYSFPPPGKSRGRIGIWDEFVCGTANKLGWLGKPEGAAVHLAATAPDCLGATGAALARRIQGRVTARATEDGVEISANSQNDSETSFTIPGVPVEGANLVVLLTMKAAASIGYPREMARFAEVGVGGGERSLMKRKLELTGMAVRGKAEQPIAVSTGARVNYGAATQVGEKLLPAYAVHPPFQGAKGYVFWCADVEVPANSELRFQLGMGIKSPEKSDGVWFSIHAAPLAGATPGTFNKLFEESSKAHQWLPRAVPLAKFAGQRIRLKFVADCGPRDNAVTDHAYWGDVKLAPAGATEDQITPPQERMTWVNDKPFASTFYFRNIRSSAVDLTFRIEGREPVTIERISAHAQPDAMARIFEHGLVLANPSSASFTFDLAKLTPGRSYRRLQATPQQDTQANDGAPVGSSVTLAPLDALFLLRTDSAAR